MTSCRKFGAIRCVLGDDELRAIRWCGLPDQIIPLIAAYWLASACAAAVMGRRSRDDARLWRTSWASQMRRSVDACGVGRTKPGLGNSRSAQERIEFAPARRAQTVEGAAQRLGPGRVPSLPGALAGRGARAGAGHPQPSSISMPPAPSREGRALFTGPRARVSRFPPVRRKVSGDYIVEVFLLFAPRPGAATARLRPEGERHRPTGRKRRHGCATPVEAGPVDGPESWMVAACLGRRAEAARRAVELRGGAGRIRRRDGVAQSRLQQEGTQHWCRGRDGRGGAVQGWAPACFPHIAAAPWQHPEKAGSVARRRRISRCCPVPEVVHPRVGRRRSRDVARGWQAPALFRRRSRDRFGCGGGFKAEHADGVLDVCGSAAKVVEVPDALLAAH